MMATMSNTVSRQNSDEVNADKCLLCYEPHTISNEEKGFCFELKNFKDIFSKSFGIQFLSHFSEYGKVYLCSKCHEDYIKVEAVYDEFMEVERRFDALREKFAFIVVESIIKSEYISNYAHTNAFDAIRYLIFKAWGDKFKRQEEYLKKSKPQQQQQMNGISSKSGFSSEKSPNGIQKKVETVISTSSTSTNNPLNVNSKGPSVVDNEKNKSTVQQRVAVTNSNKNSSSSSSNNNNNNLHTTTTEGLEKSTCSSVSISATSNNNNNATNVTNTQTKTSEPSTTTIEPTLNNKKVTADLKSNSNASKITRLETTTNKTVKAVQVPESQLVIKSVISKTPVNNSNNNNSNNSTVKVTSTPKEKSTMDTEKLIKLANIKREVEIKGNQVIPVTPRLLTKGPTAASSSSSSSATTTTTVVKATTLQLSADGRKLTTQNIPSKQRVIFVKRDPTTGKMVQIHQVPPECSLTGLDEKSLNILKKSGALQAMSATVTTSLTSDGLTRKTNPSPNTTANTTAKTSSPTKIASSIQRPKSIPTGLDGVKIGSLSAPEKQSVVKGGGEKSVVMQKGDKQQEKDSLSETVEGNNSKSNNNILRRTMSEGKLIKGSIDTQNNNKDVAGDKTNENNSTEENEDEQQQQPEKETSQETETSMSDGTLEDESDGRDSLSRSPESRPARRRTSKRVFDPNSWASGQEMEKLVSQCVKSDKKDNKKDKGSKRAKRSSDHTDFASEEEEGS